MCPHLGVKKFTLKLLIPLLFQAEETLVDRSLVGCGVGGLGLSDEIESQDLYSTYKVSHL